MGDAGSLTLGYIISLLVIHLSRVDLHTGGANQSNLVLAFSTLIVPLFDVVRVVMHRLREGKNLFLPDKNHIHHKLLRTGMRIRMVLLTILSVSSLFIVLNAVLVDKIAVTLLLLIDIAIWTVMQGAIDHYIRLQKERKAEAKKTVADRVVQKNREPVKKQI